MRIESKYSKINSDGTESLLIVDIPDNEYGNMLLKNPRPEIVRADVLNAAAYIMQKRIDIQAYIDQKLNPEQIAEVKIYAAALARQLKLIAACTDDACGYRGIQMRLAGGHRLSDGMQRELAKISSELEPPNETEIENSFDYALEQLGYCSKTQFDYDVSRCGHETWKIERVAVTGRDRETVLKQQGKKIN
jgi:hypothetical protein